MSTSDEKNASIEARRKFLKDCGKFAIVTPPAISLLLAASNQNFAVTASGGQVGHVGNGSNGGSGHHYRKGHDGKGGGSNGHMGKVGNGHKGKGDS